MYVKVNLKLQLHVNESLGNCPKYITKRDLKYMERVPGPVTTLSNLQAGLHDVGVVCHHPQQPAGLNDVGVVCGSPTKLDLSFYELALRGTAVG